MIIFFTNGSREYHWQDILNAICYPQGMVISFAYEDHYFSDGAKSWLAESVKKGEKCLIVYYDPLVEIPIDGQMRIVDFGDSNQAVATGESQEFCFFPIRFAEVLDKNKESGANTFDLRLSEFVSYRPERVAVDSQQANEPNSVSTLRRLIDGFSRYPKPNRSLYDKKSTHLVYRIDENEFSPSAFSAEREKLPGRLMNHRRLPAGRERIGISGSI